jgi:hypothetical protein
VPSDQVSEVGWHSMREAWDVGRQRGSTSSGQRDWGVTLVLVSALECNGGLTGVLIVKALAPTRSAATRVSFEVESMLGDE